MDKTETFFSIVVPLYNKQQSIESTIASLITQSYSNFEVIVVNDGSTDNSLDTVKSINDDRVIVLNKENGGVSSARNVGIQKSNGEYILFLDADDKLLPDALACFHKVISSHPEHDIYIGNFNIEKNGEIINKLYCSLEEEGVRENIYLDILKKEVFLRTGSFVFNKNNKGNIQFNNEYSYYEDLDYIFRLVENSKIYYVPNAVMSYQLDNNHLSKKIVENKNSWCVNADIFCKNKYRRMLVLDCIYSELRRKIRNKNFNGAQYLFLKVIVGIKYLIEAKYVKKNSKISET